MLADFLTIALPCPKHEFCVLLNALHVVEEINL
jgi:hypothetical protein